MKSTDDACPVRPGLKIHDPAEVDRVIRDGSMVLEFPDDHECPALDRHCMLGSSVLVAPVLAVDGGAAQAVIPGRAGGSATLAGVFRDGDCHVIELNGRLPSTRSARLLPDVEVVSARACAGSLTMAVPPSSH